jgi:hypothetical protein
MARNQFGNKVGFSVNKALKKEIGERASEILGKKLLSGTKKVDTESRLKVCVIRRREVVKTSI